MLLKCLCTLNVTAYVVNCIILIFSYKMQASQLSTCLAFFRPLIALRGGSLAVLMLVQQARLGNFFYRDMGISAWVLHMKATLCCLLSLTVWRQLNSCSLLVLSSFEMWKKSHSSLFHSCTNCISLRGSGRGNNGISVTVVARDGEGVFGLLSHSYACV